MKVPNSCPSCNNALDVYQLKCINCKTIIEGDFKMPKYLVLNSDEQKFIIDFFLCSGNIKEISKQENLSYPTIRKKINSLIEKINIKLKNNN